MTKGGHWNDCCLEPMKRKGRGTREKGKQSLRRSHKEALVSARMNEGSVLSFFFYLFI